MSPAPRPARQRHVFMRASYSHTLSTRSVRVNQPDMFARPSPSTSSAFVCMKRREMLPLYAADEECDNRTEARIWFWFFCSFCTSYQTRATRRYGGYPQRGERRAGSVEAPGPGIEFILYARCSAAQRRRSKKNEAARAPRRCWRTACVQLLQVIFRMIARQ